MHLKYKQYQIWCPKNLRNCRLRLKYEVNGGKCIFLWFKIWLCNLLSFPSIKLRINRQYFCHKSINVFQNLFMFRHCSWWIQILSWDENKTDGPLGVDQLQTDQAVGPQVGLSSFSRPFRITTNSGFVEFLWLQLEPCCLKPPRDHGVVVEPRENIQQFLPLPGTWKTIQVCVEGYWNLTDLGKFHLRYFFHVLLTLSKKNLLPVSAYSPAVLAATDRTSILEIQADLVMINIQSFLHLLLLYIESKVNFTSLWISLYKNLIELTPKKNMHQNRVNCPCPHQPALPVCYTVILVDGSTSNRPLSPTKLDFTELKICLWQSKSIKTICCQASLVVSNKPADSVAIGSIMRGMGQKIACNIENC